MSTITFETAALADVVARAARVAPTKGAAYDKAAGIIVEFNPTEPEPVTIKATDLDVTFLERLTPLECKITTPFEWRLSSALMAGILGNLPLGTSTRLEVKDDVLHVICGKAKAKLRMFTDILIRFEPFDPAPLVEVPGFAARVAQVAWACDKNSIPFTGVHIDGKRLIATDRYRLATVPCTVPVDHPITVPLEMLTVASKGASDVRLAAVGSRLHLMPSDHTQITSVIYDAKYPPVERGMVGDYDQSFEVSRDLMREAINRMLVLVKGERYPIMRLTIGQERVHIFLDVPEVGEMEDEIPVSGADHDDFVLYFTPNNFVDGLTYAAKPEVTVSYDTRNNNKNVLFEDGDGYQCWVVPRRSGS